MRGKHLSFQFEIYGQFYRNMVGEIFHKIYLKDGTMEKVLFRISKIFKSEGGFSIIVRDVFEWQKMEETQSLSLPPKAVAWELHMISLCFCFGQRG